MATACAPDIDDNPALATTLPPPPTIDETAATFPPNGETMAIRAIDNDFLPAEVTITAGTEVVWRNGGRNQHNVLPEGDPAARLWGVQVADFVTGDEYAHVFDTPGTFVYYCSLHGSPTKQMHGTITVTAP
jgi:plastocyanin